MQHLLPWTLAAISIALLTGAAVLLLMQRRKPKAEPLPTEWALAARPVFTTDERRVYRRLREALPHHVVLAKLPLVRFCQPTGPREARYWYGLLGSIHVTFAICSANGRLLVAIDLDHERARSRRTTQIKQSVLTACRVRYLRCTADHLPSIAELQLLVPQTGASGRGPPPAPAVSQARDSLNSTLASRRRERTTPWQDSGTLQDSFFRVDGRSGPSTTTSNFGGLSPSLDPGDIAKPPDEGGGIVVETPISRLRH
jgi:hypothetical protein